VGNSPTPMSPLLSSLKISTEPTPGAPVSGATLGVMEVYLRGPMREGSVFIHQKRFWTFWRQISNHVITKRAVQLRHTFLFKLLHDVYAGTGDSYPVDGQFIPKLSNPCFKALS
jgi:hypothetical protein